MGLNLLIVDDEPDIQLLMKQKLRKRVKNGDLSLTFAQDGIDALNKISETPKFDIVLSDINMPQMDGLTLLEKIRKDHAHIMVIMVSAYDDMKNIRTAMGRGANDFIVKPIDFRDLELTIDRVDKNIKELNDHNLKLEKMNLQLKNTIDQTIEAISRMGEIRDPYTAGHQKRVAKISKLLATKLNCDKQCIEAVHVAGQIHDIGKIFIPAEILCKPGPLNNVEFSLIKEHPQYGYNVLSGIDFPWPIAEIVKQHHEHFDGSGYPDGLKNDEILLQARILSVADVLEAVSSHRPYRVALGSQRGIDELIKGKNSRFDPVVVDACIELYNEGALDILEGNEYLSSHSNK